jgi:hypothetical protein
LTVSPKPPSSFFFAWVKFLGRTPTGSLIDWLSIRRAGR